MRRALKVCAELGCPELVPGGRCAQHARSVDNRPSAARRGYGTRWRGTRRDYLSKHPRCSEQGCESPATDVDHIDGLGPQGPHGHDAANLRAFCHSHHSQRTARDQPGGWNSR